MSFHEDSFHQKDQVTVKETKLWWEKYLKVDKRVLEIALLKVVSPQEAIKYFDVSWNELPNDVRKKLLKHFNREYKKAIRELK